MTKKVRLIIHSMDPTSPQTSTSANTIPKAKVHVGEEHTDYGRVTGNDENPS
tara:strand:- start:190 stop:345 length:156 start_codon:yes stop_codon:yes gene_type:complete